MEQSLAQLGGAQVFSKLDANSGFWQIKLAESSTTLTTFITPFGRFCFNHLPFGITSAPEYFQQKMSALLAGLDEVVCQMDDTLVFGKTQEHDKRLLAVLGRIRQSGLNLNPEKCEFSKTSVKFLGQIVNKNGIKADPEKIEAVSNLKRPENTSDVRRFLGMLNQLSKFSPQLSEKTKPLRDLLSTSRRCIPTN